MNVITKNFAMALSSTLSEALITISVKKIALDDSKTIKTDLSTFSASRHVVMKWVVGLCV